MTETFEALSDAQVAEEIATWAGRVAAGEARLLALLVEFDRREGWARQGCVSLAQWMSLHLGLAPNPARERARVARALVGLPLTIAAMGRGELSYSQVRAISRVAVPADEADWIGIARCATGAQLERLVRGVRRQRNLQEDTADPGFARWKMRSQIRYDDDGTMLITVKVPAEQGAVVLAALDAAREEIDRERDAAAAACGEDVSAETGSPQPGRSAREEDTDPTVRASIAEGLVRIAATTLAAGALDRPDAARRAQRRLTTLVDPLSGWARLADGEFLPPASAPPLPEELRAHLRPLVAADLTRFDLGRSTRVVSPALRTLLGQLDGECCRFPGCIRTRKLHGHHVEFWSNGGPTDLSNLVLVCSRHHTIVHAQGFQLTLRPDRTLTVRTADGVPVIHHANLAPQPAESLDPHGLITATTLPPMVMHDRLDLRYAVAVLTQQAA
ncbi:MAG TPA: HNH endonuclease signature motif containing protein [Mycobacteriales bacterium]|nr:HNH endonuclease signature motif containing protein [Mycobacteriales bacterium]